MYSIYCLSPIFLKIGDRNPGTRRKSNSRSRSLVYIFNYHLLIRHIGFLKTGEVAVVSLNLSTYPEGFFFFLIPTSKLFLCLLPENSKNGLLPYPESKSLLLYVLEEKAERKIIYFPW